MDGEAASTDRIAPTSFRSVRLVKGVHGGLAGEVWTGLIIRPKVAVRQVHLSSAPAGHQLLPIVPKPGPTQMGYDTPSRVTLGW